MQLGMLAARAVYLRGRLAASGFPLERLIEVYPAGALYILADRLGLTPQTLRRYKRDAAARAVLAEALTLRLDFAEHRFICLSDNHALDAVISAYVGWLYPDHVELPKPEVPPEDGWIYLPL